MNPRDVKNPKSALTAGVLAILLGAFGVHDWYLSDRKKARSHVIMALVGVVAFGLSLICRTLVKSMTDLTIANLLGSVATVLRIIGWFVLVIDVVWGIIDGIVLIVRGDAGLTEKGYTVAAPSPDSSQPAAGSVLSSQAPAQAPAASQANAVPPTSQAPQPPATLSAPAPNAPQPAAQPAPVGGPQPLVFHSQNIAQSSQPQLLNQTLSTQNVETPPLTVRNAAGKSSVNPVVIRKILIGVAAVAVIVIGVFVVKHGIDSAFSAGYGDAYRIAKQIMPNLTTAAKSSSCQYALDYVKTAYVDQKTYTGYIDSCKSLATADGELVAQLGQTAALKWNTEIAEQYQDFKGKYDQLFAAADQNAQMVRALDLYQIWHQYALATDILSVDSPELDFQQAADILRKSGNDTLAKYGDEWYHKEMDYINSYRTYWELSYTDPNKETQRLEVEAKRNDLQAWVDDHRPDVTSLEPLTVPNLTPMYDSFTKLYELIRTAYEKHYDSASGDCREAGNKVYCS